MIDNSKEAIREIVLFHTHGIGRIDFSSMSLEDLYEIDHIAKNRALYLCPTVFLLRNNMKTFRSLLESFSEMSNAKKISRILGFSLEGPMLCQNGGTPIGGIWTPIKEEWIEIISWFNFGLKYIVISPDLISLEKEICSGFTFANLIDLIYDSGGRIALGHFSHNFPAQSADRILAILDYLESRYFSSPYLVLTDHFLNDMPRNFKHAFRTDEELLNRDIQISEFMNKTWEDRLLISILGPVPATLLKAANDNRLALALNFDGLHVDLAICKKIVQYLGHSNIIAITDHTETNSILGELLSSTICQGLLYQSDGILAASATTHEQQLENMIRIGIDSKDIETMFYHNPLNALTYVPIRRSY